MASPAPPSAVSEFGDRKATAWTLDSFATNHMSGNRSLFPSLKPVSSNQVIGAGNGKGMRVCATGCAITEAVALPDVWFVPGLTENLVSMNQLLSNNADVTIENAGRGYIVKKTSDGSVVGRARLRSDNKYEVDFLKITQDY